MHLADRGGHQYLQSSRHLNGRLTHWALKLQSYTFTVRYRPGKSNQNADGLSRQAWPEEEDLVRDKDQDEGGREEDHGEDKPAEDVRLSEEGELSAPTSALD